MRRSVRRRRIAAISLMSVIVAGRLRRDAPILERHFHHTAATELADRRAIQFLPGRRTFRRWRYARNGEHASISARCAFSFAYLDPMLRQSRRIYAQMKQAAGQWLLRALFIRQTLLRARDVKRPEIVAAERGLRAVRNG